MSERHAAAYIRRSSVSSESPGEASREAQLAAVRRLCGDDVTVYTDWGISGRKADRPDYVKLKAAIVAGEVASVCAYSLSRLGRNARELLAFIELAQSHDVPVRTSLESIDTSSAMGRAMLTVMAAFAQLEVEQGMERSASARAAREARHEAAGLDVPSNIAPYGYMHITEGGITRRVPNPDEPLAPILAAYREAGSVLGACGLLESRGIAAPNGGQKWRTSTLTRILEREEGPKKAKAAILPRSSRAGRRTPSRALLAQLLECPFCRKMLTPNAHRGQYYCSNGALDRKVAGDRAAHIRYTVREQDVLPWVMDEAAHYQPPKAVRTAEERQGERAAIEASRTRLALAFAAAPPAIDEATWKAEDAKLVAALDGLDAQGRTIILPDGVDWTWPPEHVNAVLRSFLSHVVLDTDLRPVEAVWTLPEWRRE